MKQVPRIALPLRMQGHCLEFLGGGRWRLWMHTQDQQLGTSLELHSDGKAYRVTSRADEGDEIVLIKPKDT
jgi:hypothetical protein